MKVEYVCKAGCEPERFGSGWFDLKSAKPVVYRKGELVRVDFGVIINFPEGVEGILAPRSSLLEKHGLIMSGVGVIDNEYKGPKDYISGRFYAICDGYIDKGERLCQLRLLENMGKAELIKTTAKAFANKSRGGFGSTDKSEAELSYDKGFNDGIDYCLANKLGEV